MRSIACSSKAPRKPYPEDIKLSWYMVGKVRKYGHFKRTKAMYPDTEFSIYNREGGLFVAQWHASAQSIVRRFGNRRRAAAPGEGRARTVLGM